MAPTASPCCEAFCCAIEQSCLRQLMRATIRLPKLMLPKLYVKARFKAPVVGPFGMLFGQKYHEPYTPEMTTWIVFLSHSLIQYMAKVTKQTSPMTFPLEQPPLPFAQAGLAPTLLFPGSYFAYIAIMVREYQAPKAVARRPPMRLTE